MKKTIGQWVMIAMLSGCGSAISKVPSSVSAPSDLTASAPVASPAPAAVPPTYITSATPLTAGASAVETALAAPTFVLATTDSNAAGTAPCWKSAFTITDTNTLFVALDVSALSGHHTASFAFNLPDGSAYQQIDLAFSTDAAPDVGERQAEKTDKGYRVWVSIPVAGTSIEQFHFTGQWSSNVTMDGADSSNATVTFMLN